VLSVPVVSVLLPAHDAAATLPACLRSVRRQTETRWECVLVDDGSRDATRAIAEAVARDDPRIRVLSIPHGGIVGALGAGLACCAAPIVARMDADDVMHRDRLAAQLAALDATPTLAAVGCHVRFFPRRGMTDGLREYERWLRSIDSAARVQADAFVECPVAHPTLTIRRNVLAALGYRDTGWPEDYDLVAITSLSAQIFEAYKVADFYMSKKVPVIMGGLHVSSEPVEAKEHCNSVVIGEGEPLWPRVLADFERGSLQPYYVQSPAGLYDLRDAPMPRFVSASAYSQFT